MYDSGQFDSWTELSWADPGVCMLTATFIQAPPTLDTYVDRAPCNYFVLVLYDLGKSHFLS